MNLYSLFSKCREQVGSEPERVFLEEPATGKRFTYGDLHRITGRLANRLQALGVKPGDRVAVQVEKSPEAFFLYLATLRAGAVFLPLNPAYSEAEVRYFLGDAEPRLFVGASSSVVAQDSALRSCGARTATLEADGSGTLTDALESEPAGFETWAAGEEALAAILYTSGTTGRSKGAMLSHGNLGSNALALGRAWGFTRDDRLLHALPIYHIHGLFISLHTVLASGAGVRWLPRFDPAEVVRELSGASVFMGVPTYYTRLLDAGRLTRASAAHIRLFVSGSAPLRPETFQAFESATGHRIVERYGMTETGIIASNPLEGERVPGAVGLPLERVEIRIAEGGMIEVKGPNVFTGYWRQPGKTREEFTPDGFFRTGDLGSLDARGYLHIVGRAKDLVITGGLNVYPKEVEQVLDALEGVGESAVFGVPHPDFGEAVVAAVVPASGEAGGGIDESRLIAGTRETLAAFKAPKRVFLVDRLPRNTMGKVQKNVLRERFGKTFG